MSDSQIVEGKLPCPDCGSSDALHKYDDGHSFCFSCEKYTPGEGDTSPRRESRPKDFEPAKGEFGDIPGRKLLSDTLKKFGYRLGQYKGKQCHIAPYYKDGQLVGQKLRFANKQFMVLGTVTEGAELFGQHLWNPSKFRQRLVIVEGEIDALSYAQATALSWPVVSIPNGAKSAVKAVKRNLEFVESFEEVVLLFDMDEPGQDAARKVAEILTPGKAKIARLPDGMKDASDMLKARRVKELVTAVWDAKSTRPDGIVNGADLWEEVSRKVVMGTPYPFKFLNEGWLYGQRPGEIVTWVAGSGLGKSAFVREIAFHNAMVHGEPVGYVALEENSGRTGLGFMGLWLNKPIHLPGVEVSEEEKRRAFEATLGTGRFWVYQHFGSTDGDNLMSKLRYLVKGCGCKTLVLDHLSIVVSGMDLEGDERRMLDYTMTQLRTFTENTGANLQLVSHLKRPDGKGHEDGAVTSLSQLRGSAAIAQLSDAVIGLERNQQSDDPEERDVTTVRILKNRLAGTTGIAGEVKYDRETGRLVELCRDFKDNGNEGDTGKDDELPF